ncbi:MAG: C25 family cysteine peptidase [Thermoplasmatota archaeon]
MWDYDIVMLKGCGFTMELGKPMIPVKNIRLAVPEDTNVINIKLIEFKEQNILGKYYILPAQEILPTNAIFNKNIFVEPDNSFYSSCEPYPDVIIEFLGQCDLAGQVMVDIAVFPIRYIPAENTLTFLSSLTFQLIAKNDYNCKDYLSPNLSYQNQNMYQQMVSGMVINPDQVVLRQLSDIHDSVVSPGNYEYVIITQDSWVSAFQPLADWKTKKGIPTNIVTTTWIYNNGGYSGSDLQKIQSFIKDAHINWGTIYFLLGGDTDIIPTHYRTFSNVNPEPVPNDTYYSDYDNDWVCEVHVARASVTGPGSGNGQIGNFINKILNYEKNIPTTGFAKKAGFFGFDLDGNTYAEQLKINIRNNYVPASWSITTVYDSHNSNHRTEVINAINVGQNLINHADHCNSNYLGTGYVNHNWGLTNSDILALTNNNRQGIFYSLGCWPAAFDEPVSIAEHFVRNNNGGGVAFIGNSRYGYYNSGTYDTLSMKYDAYFFKSLLTENNYKLGIAFSDHKNDAYQWDLKGYYKYLFTGLTLLGDPEMPIWTENPISLTASFPTQIPIESLSFTVTVKSGNSPVNQAYVCLWKDNDIYRTGFTNSAGQVTFSLTPKNSGKMYVTVTKQNYIPFEGITIVGNLPPNNPNSPEGPSSGKISVEYTFSTSTTDPNDDPVFYWFDWGDGTNTGWIGPYNSGTSTSSKHTWTTKGTYQVKVKAKDVFGAESDWSDPLLVTISRNRGIDKLLLRLFDIHPLLFKILPLFFKGLKIQ